MTGGQSTASRVTVEVPVRVCDVGGWTDTWFAGHGRVCSLAVGPGVSVTASATPGRGSVTVSAPAYGVSFLVGSEPPEHRLLAEAVREAGPAPDADVHVEVTAAVPPASSLGTSAAVTVGLITALDAIRGRSRHPVALAEAAHRVETDRLRRQSGVQDQVAAAHGGINLIEVTPYPTVSVTPLAVDAGCRAALDQGLVHVAYGGAHDSSAVHEEVIALLTAEGRSAPRLRRLRDLASEAAAALAAGDLERYGRALSGATDAQAALHRSLVSEPARALIAEAQSLGALGWKVNGAGGAGGSISILCRPSRRDRMVDAAVALGHTPLALRLAEGARIL